MKNKYRAYFKPAFWNLIIYAKNKKESEKEALKEFNKCLRTYKSKRIQIVKIEIIKTKK